MASQSCRNVIEVLSLCESCAISLRNSNGQSQNPNPPLGDIIEEIEKSAREACKNWSHELTQKEADKIAECMQQAGLVFPDYSSALEEQTTFNASLALGLLDELFGHIRDSWKVKLLDRVERAIRNLQNHFDQNLDRFSIYEQASQAVTVWLKCLNA